MAGEFSKQDRLARFLLIINLLQRHPQGLTAKQVGDRVGRTARTVYRDMVTLGGELHIPVWNDEKGRWFLDSKAFLPPLNLSLQEAVTLFLSARLAARFSDKRDQHIVSSFAKLASILPPNIARHVDATTAELSQLPENDPYERVFDALARAWSEGKKVRIWYPYERPEGTQVYERTVSPYFLEPYASGHSCYLIGHDAYTNAVRVFKVERIQRAEGIEESFEIPPDFDVTQRLKHAWGIADGNIAEVRLLFTEPGAVKRLRESRWHPSQAEHARQDGTLEVTFEVAGLTEITPWILGWGAAVEVLSPPELRDQVAATARSLAARYEPAATPA